MRDVPSLSRRDALRLGSAVTAALAGCAAFERPSSGAGTTTTATSATLTATVTRLPAPENPETLAPESAVAFVERAERARIHDDLWRATVQKISLDCHAALHRETPAGFVVVAGCGGYANYPRSHADLGGTPATYFVSSDRTVRVYDRGRVERIEAEAYTGPEGATATDTAVGVRFYNLDAAAHALTVRLTHRDSGDVAVERTETVAGGAGRYYRNLARRAGAYRLELSTESGATATHEVDHPAGHGAGPLVGTLVESGLALEREPAFEAVRALGPV